MDIELGFSNITNYLLDETVPRLDKFKLLLNGTVLDVAKEYCEIQNNDVNESIIIENWLRLAMTRTPKNNQTGNFTSFFESKDIPFEEKMYLIQIDHVQTEGNKPVRDNDDMSKSPVYLKDRWKKILSDTKGDLCFENYKGNSDVPESFFENKVFEDSDSYVRPLHASTKLTAFYNQKHSMIFHDHMRRKKVSTSVLRGLYSENRSVIDYIDGKSNAEVTKQYLFGLYKVKKWGELVNHYGDIRIDPLKIA